MKDEERIGILKSEVCFQGLCAAAVERRSYSPSRWGAADPNDVNISEPESSGQAEFVSFRE
jgi:hypothetical protein